jgi:competence protein ComEA
MISETVKKLTATATLLGAVVLGASVVSEGQVAPGGGTLKAKISKKAVLDLNKATIEQLQDLPGVGEATAKKIIAGRPYSKVDDLAKAGVPARTIEGIRALVQVAPAAAKSKKAMTSSPASAKVNINTADKATLETLPGVGGPTAQAIIDGRPYKSIDDLDRVRGLGRRRLDALRDRVTAGESDTTAATGGAVAKKLGGGLFGKRVPPAGKAMTKVPAAGRININTATKDELDALPGIGPVRAQAIIDARKTEPFKTIQDIMKVRGIKEGEFAKIRELISVE